MLSFAESHAIMTVRSLGEGIGELVHRDELPADSPHDPAEYTTRRLHATSADGTQASLTHGFSLFDTNCVFASCPRAMSCLCLSPDGSTPARLSKQKMHLHQSCSGHAAS